MDFSCVIAIIGGTKIAAVATTPNTGFGRLPLRWFNPPVALPHAI